MLKDELLKIFLKGIQEFNKRNYYDSHEYFEEIWTNHVLDDRLFVQGLIQLSVAYFHISNDNKNGAISLFKKSIKKLDNYIDCDMLILNINDVIKAAYDSHAHLCSINNMHKFNWELAPKLKFNDLMNK